MSSLLPILLRAKFRKIIRKPSLTADPRLLFLETASPSSKVS
jgi:hypothetical protein